MNPDQIQQLLAILADISKSLSSQPVYTLTGAADWPILSVVGGGFAALALAAWFDLRSQFAKAFSEGKTDLASHKVENKEEHQMIWSAMKDCQSDCCPRTKER